MLDRACRNTVFPLADAVEVYNGRGSERENAFSHEIAEQFGPDACADDILGPNGLCFSAVYAAGSFE